MGQSTTGTATFTPCAALAALGCHLRRLDLFAPIRAQVRIAQKTVTHTPADKLYDAFIAILAGAHGLVEVNTRLRSDPALQLAFGRTAAEPYNPTTVGERANRAWKAAKLEPLTLHEARHTYPSLMIAASVNAKALATFMATRRSPSRWTATGTCSPAPKTKPPDCSTRI